MVGQGLDGAQIVHDRPDGAGGDISEPVGPGVVLVRLHSGNFNFGAVKEDGSDLRFVAEDDKTILPHQIEKWDGLLNEAFVWVKAPEIKPGAKATFWLYSGNAEATALDAKEAKGTYDADTVLVYHFAGAGAPQDASEGGNTAENAGRRPRARSSAAACACWARTRWCCPARARSSGPTARPSRGRRGSRKARLPRMRPSLTARREATGSASESTTARRLSR